jgi:hypothetical protein
MEDSDKDQLNFDFGSERGFRLVRSIDRAFSILILISLVGVGLILLSGCVGMSKGNLSYDVQSDMKKSSSEEGAQP